jgi:hypothetical protein
MASVEAVPVRIMVPYMIIWSYWEAIRSQRIGRIGEGFSCGHAPWLPGAGR